MALISKFGRKVLGTYLVAIAAVGVMMGVIFDSLYDNGFYTPVAAAGVYEHGGITPLETGSSVILLVLAVVSISRTSLTPG